MTKAELLAKLDELKARVADEGDETRHFIAMSDAEKAELRAALEDARVQHEADLARIAELEAALGVAVADADRSEEGDAVTALLDAVEGIIEDPRPAPEPEPAPEP